MKHIITLILVQLMLNFSFCHAQEIPEKAISMSEEVEKLIQLGRDSIIQLALKSVNEKVGLENFAKTRILTNGKEVYVSFTNPIKFLHNKSELYFDVGVNILLGEVYKGSVANPIGYSDEKNIPFYQQTEVINKHIRFVIEAINNIENSDLDSFEDEMIIRENEGFYAVEVISKFQESKYKIKKESGQIFDVVHSHLEPLPLEVNNTEKFTDVKFHEN